VKEHSSRNQTADQPGCLYGTGKDGQIIELAVTRRTPKRVYFKIREGWETYISRDALERDGQVFIPEAGLADAVGSVLYRERPARAVAVTRAPPTASDSARNDDDGVGQLWQELRLADWSSNEAAYATAGVARRIITGTPMTIAAFAAECARRHISGFGSQASVSRRLRWADLHDDLWAAGILPRTVFLTESATRPLFDGKLKKADRLRLLAELFGPHLSDEAKRKLAEELNEALMRERLNHGAEGPDQYRAPRTLNPRKVIARLLAQGVTAGEISKIARTLEDSARNTAGVHSADGTST